MQDTKTRSSLGLASFIVGLISIFTFQIIVVPILAVIFGAVALSRFDPATQKGKWMAVMGLILGILYALLGSIRLLGF